MSFKEGVLQQAGGDCSWHRLKTLLGERPTHVENRKDSRARSSESEEAESGAASSGVTGKTMQKGSLDNVTLH